MKIWCPACQTYEEVVIHTYHKELEKVVEKRCDKCHRTVEAHHYPYTPTQRDH